MSKPTLFLCAPTFSPIGGVETWIDKLCRAMGDHGWRAVVGLARGASGHRPEAWIEAHPGLDTIEIDGRGMSAEGRIRAIVRAIRKVRPNVFIAVNMIDGWEAACRLKAAGDPLRHVMVVQGNLTPQLADMRRYRDFVDLLACPGALTTRIGTCWAGLPANRVRHIPNGAPRPVVNHVPRRPTQPLRIGYVGRFSQGDKRILDLIRLCRHLADLDVEYRLEIVGAGSCRDELERGIAAEAPPEAFQFHGQMSLDAIYESTYPNLDCLLLFSQTESFGIVLAEAMMHGVVPVSSRFIGHRSERLVRDRTNALLFDIGDTRTAAEHCKRLADDRDLWQRLSSAGREQILDEYTWGRSVGRWIDAFNDVLHLPPMVGQRPAKRCCTEPPGRLDRLGVPPAVTDLVRRARRAVFGVPKSMIGGEEWPMVNKDYAPALLDEIRAVTERLDGESESALAGVPTP